MRACASSALLLLLGGARAGFSARPARLAALTPRGAAATPPPRLAQPAARAPAAARRPAPLQQWALPAASYAGLAATTAGSLKLLATGGSSLAMSAGALLGFVGLPVGLLAARLATSGGPGLARSMGGAPADVALARLAREAALAVGVAPPHHVFEIDAQEPNAFAASGIGGGDATVAVTRGLRALLSEAEVSAVLAHEMGHLRHRDVSRNMHVAVAIAGLSGVYDAGRQLLRSSARGSGSSRKGGGKADEDGGGERSLGYALMAAGLGSQAVAHALRLGPSRGAELRADRAAAEAFGAGAMISALRKIDRAAARRPADLRASGAGRALAFAMISDGPSPAPAAPRPAPAARPLSRGPLAEALGLRGAWAKLARALRTHPPLEQRVAALEGAVRRGEVRG